MKLNKIFMALAAMAIVGCSSEDLNEFAPQQPVEDSRLVELNPNFVLAGVGAEGSVTRTHWEFDASGKTLVNKFLPIYGATAPAGLTLDNYADVLQQAVGLCWLGQGAVGTDVYTNYQFYHFGWLNNGQAKAEFECDELMNGSMYTDITATAGTPLKEAVPSTDWGTAGLKTKSIKSGKDNLNYNSGVYKTDNKAIFGGNYIVYYPFNPEFKNAGTIPAIAETTFNKVSESFDTPEIGKATFRYSSPVTIEGGDQAADFGLYNLSSLVQLRVATPVGDPFATVKAIDQIVLYSAKKQLLKQANLAADQIVAGKKGADLYTTTEGTKTITANFTAPVTLQDVDQKAPTLVSAYITVLPTTVEDLVVLVHNATDKTWARIDMANTVFEAGSAKVLNITVTKDDFKSEFIAVDEPSLIKARNEARNAGKGTVTIIGDITLVNGANNPYDFNSKSADTKITYTGDAIIVPEDVVLNAKTIFKSDIRLLGKSCCSGTNGAILNVTGGTLNNVTMVPTEAKATTPALYDQYNPTVNYNAAATIAAGKTIDVQAGNVNVNAAIQHKGNINIAKDAKVTVNATGDLNFMGSTVVNDGTIEVLQGGKFDMTDKNGNATANDGKRMTNNGTFIHNVDAGVGTAVQKMQQNGEYRCRVNKQIKLDDAFLQWTACSVIEIVNDAASENYNLGTAAGITPEAYKHNGKYIDIEVNCGGGFDATFTNPADGSGNGDSKEIQIGNLKVLNGGLYVDYVTGTGKRTLTVKGDMEVKVNTQFTDSKKINVEKNLTVDGAYFLYAGAKKNEDGLAVTGDITVSGGGFFDAGMVNALNITSANFYLKGGSLASFGNRTEGDTHNLTVSGIIDNPSGCTFSIIPANQNGAGSVLAWVSCTTLKVGGTFPGPKPRVD